jgi:hypothetical protein
MTAFLMTDLTFLSPLEKINLSAMDDALEMLFQLIVLVRSAVAEKAPPALFLIVFKAM